MRLKEHLSRALIAGGLALLALAVGLWIGQKAQQMRAEETQREAGELYYGDAGLIDWLLPSACAEEMEETPEIQQDFLKLYEANADVVGWLRAGENIDDPVVQRDNEYYLEHSFYGKSDSNGALFLNGNNTLFPRDDVLLIHGHNMRSGAMFGKLTRFRDYSYMAEHPLVMFRTIYDSEEVYYTPVFAFDASMQKGNSDYFDITSMRFEDDPMQEGEVERTERRNAEFQQYLDALSERSVWQAATDVTVEDKLLMLVTCSYFQEDGRFVLVCRALRENETPEQISELYQAALEEQN